MASVAVYPCRRDAVLDFDVRRRLGMDGEESAKCFLQILQSVN